MSALYSIHLFKLYSGRMLPSLKIPLYSRNVHLQYHYRKKITWVTNLNHCITFFVQYTFHAISSIVLYILK